MGKMLQMLDKKWFAAVAIVALWTLAPGRARAGPDDGIGVKWDNGFRVVNKADPALYYLRIRFAIQFRYTYIALDNSIVANSAHDVSTFLLRRARLFADGNAPNKNWYYFLHVQLEPQGGVNLHDGIIRWQRFRPFRIQFGRSKIPYGLEFHQSGFALNGVERTIFTGETDKVDKEKDVFGNTITPCWPGGNADFPVSKHTIYGTLFPKGGFTLYRSQGLSVDGELPASLLRGGGILRYWAGLFNGRDTRGLLNSTNHMLYTVRLAWEPFGRMNLIRQGDMPTSQHLKAAFLVSSYFYRDQASWRYDSATATYVQDKYDVEDYGYDLALAVRYRGFSADLEYGFENFQMQGDTPDNRDDYDRMGGRVNLGWFVIPDRLELSFKWGYVERIHRNGPEASMRTGLGLVETRQGTAVEKNLQQYTWSINWYLHGHQQKMALDYSLMIRGLAPAEPGGPGIDAQQDHRVRVMYQHLF